MKPDNDKNKSENKNDKKEDKSEKKEESLNLPKPSSPSIHNFSLDPESEEKKDESEEKKH